MMEHPLVAQGWDTWWAPEGATGKGLVGLTVIGLAIFWAVDRGCHLLQPFFGSTINTSERRQRLFLLSTVHAIIVTAFSLYKLALGDGSTYGNREIITFTLAYFINDSLGSASEWLTHPSEFVHHALAIGLTASGGLGVPEVSKFIPAFLLVEGSTPFYNATWFLKKNGHGETKRFAVMTLCFVLLFFVLRVLWLPYSTYNVMFNHTEDYHAMGIFKFSLVPICLLQFYWFTLIMKKVWGIATGSDKAKKKAKKNADKSDGASASAKKSAPACDDKAEKPTPAVPSSKEL